MEGYTKKVMMIIMLVICMIGSMANGQGSFCKMPISGLNDCKPSVSNNVANPVDPSFNSPCCKAVRGADLDCLCGYKDSPYLRVYGIDPTKAMLLPIKCKAKDPSWSC
ncbi:hypothetical protein HN51_010262 [Arachis hypogaea]|nr:Putative lipid-transfer protein [Arachis hypogaea]